MKLSKFIRNSANAVSILPEAAASRNLRVLSSFMGPGYRGLIQQKGKNEPATTLLVSYKTTFDWRYERGQIPKMQQLYEMAKASQWNAAKDIDWSIDEKRGREKEKKKGKRSRERRKGSSLDIGQ